MEKEIGKILKRLRAEKGLTQKLVAEKIKKPIRTIQRLEGGKTKGTSLPLIFAYLRTIGIPYLNFFAELVEKIEELDKKKEITEGVRLIPFPEHYKKMIGDYLNQKGVKEVKRYLRFAEEYFSSLAHLSPTPLLTISERYKRGGLDQILLRKVKKMTISAFNWARTAKEKRLKLGEKEKRYYQVMERARKRVKDMIFKTKGATSAHLRIHLGMLSSAYGLVNKNKGKPSEKEIKEWVRKKEKEGGEGRILEGMIKIMAEEYHKEIGLVVSR